MVISQAKPSARKTPPTQSAARLSLGRRNFLRSSGTAVAAMTAASYSQVLGANERVQIACIGVRGRGKAHLREFARDERSEVAAVVDIDQAVAERAAQQTLQGKAEGLVLDRPAGSGGFGYDPLFFFPPLGKGFAEISAETKWKHSHRGAAFRQMLGWLRGTAPSTPKPGSDPVLF